MDSPDQPRESFEDRFARSLRHRRELLGLTQADVARMMRDLYGVDLHVSAIAKIENRDVEKPRAIRVEEAVAYAGVLGLKVNDVISEATKVEKATLAAEELSRQYSILQSLMRGTEEALLDLRDSDETSMEGLENDVSTRNLWIRLQEALKRIKEHERWYFTRYSYMYGREKGPDPEGFSEIGRVE